MNKRLSRNGDKQNTLNNKKRKEKKKDSTVDGTGVQLSRWGIALRWVRPSTDRDVKDAVQQEISTKGYDSHRIWRKVSQLQTGVEVGQFYQKLYRRSILD